MTSQQREKAEAGGGRVKGQSHLKAVDPLFFAPPLLSPLSPLPFVLISKLRHCKKVKINRCCNLPARRNWIHFRSIFDQILVKLGLKDLLQLIQSVLIHVVLF